MIDKAMDRAISMFIGKQYVEGTFATENNRGVELVYREIAEVNKKLFDDIPYKVVFTDDDPYVSAADMRKKVVAEKEIRIYTGGCDHRFLSAQENLISRAVHDVWAHMVCGCPFTFQGEFNAYREQRRYYPRNTWAVLFAEIPAQTAAHYYMKEQTGEDFNYTQRAFAAPIEWSDLCNTYLEHDYSANSVASDIMMVMGGFGG
jgi:hypothetical protein